MQPGAGAAHPAPQLCPPAPEAHQDYGGGYDLLPQSLGGAPAPAYSELEAQGQALLLGPADIEGMSTLRHNDFAMERLYGYGYQDGRKAAAFLAG